ncbi:hypothetical protein MalM25_16160 [Planctomycetes bacterium MalM25]|nr:hypothetical protein MalM25_16160 [Planctomycetes bacterium MalM25]
MQRIDGFTELIPLAQRSAWDALGTRFQGEYLTLRAEDLVGFVVVVALLIGGFYLLRLLASWQEQGQSQHSPRRLMAELCDAHGLGFRERRLCRRVAKELQLKQPAELFVRTEALKQLAKSDAALAKRLLGQPQ